MTIGKRIQAARKAANLSTEQLADAIGEKTVTVRAWCYTPNLHPQAGKIVKLCAALGIDPNYLFDFKELMPKQVLSITAPVEPPAIVAHNRNPQISVRKW